MSNKVLVVSDVHIHAYPNRNPSNDYRLYQGSRIVPQNIIEAAKAEGCEYIVLAGDIAEKSIMRPYVEAEIKFFLDTLMSYFKEGWIIWGNHDQDNKSSEQSITDSSLFLMLPPNLHYAHQSEITLGNTRIAFNNWQPEFDLTWINGKVDILITHARINYTGNANFQSQELDETKFDLAICGDIHSAASVGKYVSIGVPQKCKMGDSDDSTGVVFDCDTKQWKWTNLNPQNNLMKFVYTDQLDQEGWNQETQTWSVYKPSSVIQTTTGIVISPWQQIETMVNDTIEKAGMDCVHNQVLSNIQNLDANEVDFNFQLTYFHCENWRSIDSLSIYFQPGDKILIRGANGSGKTSLLSALKYAFVDVKDTIGLTSLKPFIQFGTKKCLTEVEFLYQGNKYKITRGSDSKDCGLCINDVQQKYSDKNSFEKDVRERFPFIKYMDAFFFDSEHHQFIGGTSQERITEIVSKFLKLDRLDTFNQTAKSMIDFYKVESNDLVLKKKELEGLIGFIQEKINTMALPSSDKQTIQGFIDQGNAMMEANRRWLEYEKKLSSYTSQLDFFNKQSEELEKEIALFRNKDIINSEIIALQEKNKTLQENLGTLNSLRTELNLKTTECNKLRAEGNRLWTEAQSIQIGASCPTCGQKIETPEAVINHKNELLKKVEELKPQVDGLAKELENLNERVNNSSAEYNSINQEIMQNNSEISKLMSEIQHQSTCWSQLETLKKNIDSITAEKDRLQVVPKQDLPENFMETMSSLQQQLGVWTMWESSINDLNKKQEELGIIEGELQKYGTILMQLDSYVKLTGPTGIIYEEIMNNLKTKFSDNLVQYTVIRKGTGAKEHLSLRPEFFNNGNWVPYDACSSGQKTVLDIHFMSKIVSGLGILVLDEFLKHLDPQNHDICIDIIKDMNISCTMLSSHMESVAAFNNKTYKLSLNNAGLTSIEID